MPWQAREFENSPGGTTASDQSSEETALPANGGANSGAFPEDLAIIAQFWPTLSKHVKTAILGLIRAAGQNKLDSKS